MWMMIRKQQMKELMKIVPDEEEVAVDAIPLATKPPSIVDWKIVKEGKISYYQIIRADRSSKSHREWYSLVDSFKEHCRFGEVESSLIAFHSKLNIFYHVLDHGSSDEHEKSIVEVF
ncbi:hypothetical protein Tco_0033583 [Tanacetum coccineum]